MRIGVIGVNHKLAHLKLREALAKTCQKHFGALRAVHGNHHFILLSTCNRTEIYFCSNDLAVTHSYILNFLRTDVKEEFDHKLYSYFGSDCFNHLIKVTAGLDSAIFAETEIQGQVKNAYETVKDYHFLYSELHFLFQKSLNMAKKVRTELDFGRGMPSLEHMVYQKTKNFFLHPEKTRLLFIGTSSINLKILAFLKLKKFQHLTICNRSQENASATAQHYGISTLAWSALDHWPTYECIIVGTKSPDYLMHVNDLHQKKVSAKLVIDLSVPRNVDPRLGENHLISLLNIDELNSDILTKHHDVHEALSTAEQTILEASTHLIKRYQEKTPSKIRELAIIA